MKKLILIAVTVTLVCMMAGVAFASAAGNTGCGLGTLLWGSRADNSVLSQTLQVTTNGIFGNQTFGITTGTLQCSKPASFVSNERTNEFVVANMDNLARDIAAGRGETLDAFAELMQIPVEERAAFAGKLQASFGRIFTGQNVAMADVLDNVSAVSAR